MKGKDETMSVIRVIKKFRLILSSRQKLRIMELVVLMIIGGFLEMCSVSLMLPFMNVMMSPDEAMEKWYIEDVCSFFHIDDARTFLVVMAAVLAAIYILKNVYLVLEYNIQYRFVYGNMMSMENRILNSYLYRPYEFFLSASSGEIVRSINQDIPNVFALLSSLLGIFTELIVSGILVITLFILTPFLTICIAMLMMVLMLGVNFVLKPKLRVAGIAAQKASAGMNKWLLQSIQGIKEVKVTESEVYFQNSFDKYGRVYVNAARKQSISSVLPKFIIEAFSMAGILLLVALIVYGGSSLETIVPVLSAVAMATVRLMPSANRISQGLAMIAYNDPMLDKVVENLSGIELKESIPMASDGGAEEKEGGIIKTIHQELSLDKITFRYPNTDANVLESASMVIKKGDSVGIVGSSGAGKTTAVDILLGLLVPQTGKVLADGTDIKSDMRGWHRQIGYIPQMIFMLDDTIRHNITFGEEEENISDDKVWRALDEASLGDFVRGLPDGIETEIGERGIRLSGGQRQRIGIARALYRDPDILVFDEATSALDNETEAEIMESIHRLHGRKTMVIIAHRLTTIEACDHIFRVEDGKIRMER